MKYSSGGDNDSSTREMSLVEQKKRQWAKEREEMSKFNEFFATTATTTRQFERTSIRTYYSNVDLSTTSSNFNSDTVHRPNYSNDTFTKHQHSNLHMNNNNNNNTNNNNHNKQVAAAAAADSYVDNDGYGYYHSNDNLGISNVSDDSKHYFNENIRSPSLPPIACNTNNRVKQHHQQLNTDEETSGYLSDNRRSPTIWINPQQQQERKNRQQRIQQLRPKNIPSHYGVFDGTPEMQAQYCDNNRSANGDIMEDSENTVNEWSNHVTKANSYLKHRNRHQRPHDSENDSELSVLIQQKQPPPPQPPSKVMQHKQLNADIDEIDDNEHETDFSIPKTPSSTSSDASRKYSGLSSYPRCRKEREERAKWGHRNGVELNHLYDSVSKEGSVKSSNGPCWLERGFAESGDESVRSYSFIRGQNAPVDPTILAERASRRMKALEFQNAIKEQLEERERLKQMEYERALLEERRHEDRIRKQIEINEQRVEEEQRRQKEKLENEQKKQEMMRAAIEKARLEAEMEKAKRKRVLHSLTPLTPPPPPTVKNDSNQSETSRRQDLDEMPVGTNAVKSQGESTNRSGYAQHNNDDNSTSSDGSNSPNEPNEPIDDGEKILIGTPIRMRKKTINKATKALIATSNKEKVPAVAGQDGTDAETDINGIALVLQTLPPIVPILSNDIINLNQNINSLNTSNIQLAVMLAHQMQQLNSIAQNQKQEGPATANQVKNLIDKKSENDSVKPLTIPNDEQSKEDADPETVCRHCNVCIKNLANESVDQIDSSIQKLHISTKDSGTSTNDIDDFNSKIQDQSIPNDLLCESNRLARSTTDAATQTDYEKSEPCFDCHFSQCHHHHHHVIVSAKNTEDYKSKSKCLDKDCGATIEISQRNQTAKGDGSHDMSKDAREHIKLEDRPKWGVNRPLQQYVKASERDPFYLRNKRKNLKRRIASEGGHSSGEQSSTYAGETKDDMHVSRSTSPSPSIVTNSTVTLSSPQLNKSNRNSSKRKVCTEILPIKTDMNGRVYLNFQEASVTMSEDETRQTLKDRYNNMNRIMKRCQTSNSLNGHSDNEGETTNVIDLEFS